MGKLIGFIVFLLIVSYFTNNSIDSKRVKKWWGDDDR
jgi:hypothetical protein